MVGHLHELYPTLRHVSADLDLGWSGLRPMSADGVPVIGALPGADNAILATGHAMLGLTYAPATATLVGRIVAGERLESDALLLSPERFVRRLSLGGRR
jgi:D-amino-acid dehydrogenase